MPVNNLIAHGIQGVGQDVPNVLQAIDQRQRQNALLAMQQDQNARVNDQDRRQAFMELGGVAARILQIPDARQRRAAAQQATQVFARQFAATGVQPGGDINALSDQQLDEALNRMATFAQQAPQDEGALVPYVNDKGAGVYGTRSEARGKPVYEKPPAPDKPSAKWATLTPDEVKAAGLPPGTSAQRNADTGQIEILNKREGLSAAEQKTIRDAKMRMPRLEAATRRVDRLGQAVASLANNVAFDGGPMDAKVLQYTKEGREVMAAQAQLVAELTALTRVPGIGSQSDLETRLANLAMPSLDMPPEVNARSMAELQAFIGDLKAAYQSLLNGGQGEPQQAAAPSSGGWSITPVQ